MDFGTPATSDPVRFGPVTDEGNGTYTSTVTAPHSIGSPEPQYAMIAAQTLSETVTATIPSTDLSASSLIELGYPTLHTVQYPRGRPAGSPAPGLYDDQGRQLFLDGAEAFGGWGGPSPTMFSQFDGSPIKSSTWEDEITHMASSLVSGASSYTWGFDVVRIPLSDSYWLSGDAAQGCGSPYIEKIDDLINWVTSNDMIADLDLHYVVDGYMSDDYPSPADLPCLANATGQEVAEAGVPDGLPMADARYAPTFWLEVAKRYGDPSSTEYNPLVVFDLYNEPDMTSQSSFLDGRNAVQVWQHGGSLLDTTFGPDYYYQVAGMDQLYQSVRSRAPSTPVIVSGVGPNLVDPYDGSGSAFDISPVVDGDPLSGPPSSTPVVIGNPSEPGIPGTNVIYSSHPYFGANCSLLGSLSDGDESDLEKLVAPVAQNYPVIFGEIGSDCLPASLGGNALQYNITWAKDNGLVGYVVWNWAANTDSNTYGVLECDPLVCPAGNPYEPNAYGIPEFNGDGSMLN